MSTQTGMELTQGGEGLPATHEPHEVATLVELAIREKVPVEALERLVALQERVTERNARAAFVEALARFRETCPPVVRSRTNEQFKVTRNGAKVSSKYAGLEDIDRVARPAAAECGLVWTWDTRVDAELMHVTCRVTHVMGHSECSTVSMPYESKAGSSPQQKYGSTQTYGMRYSLIAALGITTADEDVDGAGPQQPRETITAEQAADLDALIDEVGADRGRFLRYMRVESLTDIPADQLRNATSALEQKRGR